MRLLSAVRRKPAELDRGANDPLLSFDQYLGLLSTFGFNGIQYTLSGQTQEEIGPTYAAVARAAYKSNGVVFACMLVRQLLLSEARFAFRERRNGRPGNLFTDASLAPLEAPWPGATTGDLIARMDQHASLAGNWFGTNRYGGVRSLRPDWVTLVIGSNEDPETAAWDPDAEVIGYIYRPGGPGAQRPPVHFLAEEVAHYAPIPDPEAQFRGMSWLTPVVREIMADKAATDHKLAFFENAATPNLHVKLDVPDLDAFEGYVKKFRDMHEGQQNAYRTLFTAAGADATVIGSNLHEMDFRVTQGAGETRISAASGVPAVIVGLSEGLQAATYSNYEQAMRRLTDLTARPLWRNMAGSLQLLVPPPHSGAELWYDDRDIPALQEDIRKAGERMQADAAAIASLVAISGYTPESAVDAVTSGDLNRLVHSGLVPVQQHAPSGGTTPGQNPPGEQAALNGAANGKQPELAPE